jgi:hypothetical protein
LSQRQVERRQLSASTRQLLFRTIHDVALTRETILTRGNMNQIHAATLSARLTAKAV